MKFDRYDSLGTMFTKVAEIADKDERREALRELAVNERAAALLIQYMFHPDVEWDLPPGPVPESEFTRSSIPNHKGLIRVMRKFTHIMKGSPVRKFQKQVILKGILEVLQSEDIDLVQGMLQGKMPHKTLNKLFTMAAIPELFPPAATTSTDKSDK